MTRYWTLGPHLPHALAAPLFGDRARFGLAVQPDDPDWVAWQDFGLQFYQATQKQGLGKVVNDAGYQILQRVDLSGKRVLELGPGILPHRRFWKGIPQSYAIVDIRQEMLDRSAAVLRALNIPVTPYGAETFLGAQIEGPFDVILSFYSFEHLHPLGVYLDEMQRLLSPGGILAGCIPCEGGLAWGSGRFFTTRRYIRQHSAINPDKIICWEHVNFAESILLALESRLAMVRQVFWPWHLPFIDLNLVTSFVCEKQASKSSP